MQEQVFQQELWPVKDPGWSSLFLRDCTSRKGPKLYQFLKNSSLWEGPMLEQFVKDCLLQEGPHTGAGKQCEEEGVAEMKCYELTTTPIPHPPESTRMGGD